MDILSTLKGEYSRTLLLIVIPGAIALEPYGVMLYNYYDLHVLDLKDFFVYAAFVYFFSSIFLGFIIQDLGSRLEILFDKLYCRFSKRKRKRFMALFTRYLFNERKEQLIITHYYRSLLIRLRFELHSAVAIIILWAGMLVRAFVIECYKVDWHRTKAFIIISGLLFLYLLFEAYTGVKVLHLYRTLINRKFKPYFTSSVNYENQPNQTA